MDWTDKTRRKWRNPVGPRKNVEQIATRTVALAI
jgi:hypothetical protein